MSITWSDDLLTGDEQVDREHISMISIANAAEQAYKFGFQKEVVLEILRQLNDYVSTHFSNEEKFMQRIKYPLYLQHQTIHGKLKNRLSVLVREFESTNNDGVGVIMDFMCGWILNHIAHEDKMIASFVKERRTLI